MFVCIMQTTLFNIIKLAPGILISFSNYFHTIDDRTWCKNLDELVKANAYLNCFHNYKKWPQDYLCMPQKEK